jgi:hypothetical protein
MKRRNPVESTFAVAVDFASSTVGRALHEASADGFDGALAFSGSASGRIYCFEGSAYAAEVEGFTPDVERRLVTSGALTAGDSPRAAVTAMRLTPEALASVNQEFLLALLGRLAELPGLAVARLPQVVTAEGCTLPIPFESLVEVIRLRQVRSIEDLSHVGGAASAQVVLAQRGDMPTGLPELSALWTALGDGSELDAAAAACGLSRAEALHLAANLLRQEAATVISTWPRVSGPPAVPEAVGAGPGRRA